MAAVRARRKGKRKGACVRKPVRQRVTPVERARFMQRVALKTHSARRSCLAQEETRQTASQQAEALVYRSFDATAGPAALFSGVADRPVAGAAHAPHILTDVAGSSAQLAALHAANERMAIRAPALRVVMRGSRGRGVAAALNER